MVLFSTNRPEHTNILKTNPTTLTDNVYTLLVQRRSDFQNLLYERIITMLKYEGIISLGERVTVSDPCYDIGTWCMGELNNVLPGTYKCFYDFDEDEQRVYALIVHHNDMSEEEVRTANENSTPESFEVGVDSGMAGVYDSDYYAVTHGDIERNDKWYDAVCKLVCNNDAAHLDDKAFITSSGFGDGGYTCYTHRNSDNRIDFIKIVYINETDDDE